MFDAARTEVRLLRGEAQQGGDDRVGGRIERDAVALDEAMEEQLQQVGVDPFAPRGRAEHLAQRVDRVLGQRLALEVALRRRPAKDSERRAAQPPCSEGSRAGSLRDAHRPARLVLVVVARVRVVVLAGPPGRRLGAQLGQGRLQRALEVGCHLVLAVLGLLHLLREGALVPLLRLAHGFERAEDLTEFGWGGARTRGHPARGQARGVCAATCVRVCAKRVSAQTRGQGSRTPDARACAILAVDHIYVSDFRAQALDEELTEKLAFPCRAIWQHYHLGVSFLYEKIMKMKK